MPKTFLFSMFISCKENFFVICHQRAKNSTWRKPWLISTKTFWGKGDTVEKFLLSNFLWSHTTPFGHILLHLYYKMWQKSRLWEHKKFDSKNFFTVSFNGRRNFIRNSCTRNKHLKSIMENVYFKDKMESWNITIVR